MQLYLLIPLKGTTTFLKCIPLTFGEQFIAHRPLQCPIVGLLQEVGQIEGRDRNEGGYEWMIWQVVFKVALCVCRPSKRMQAYVPSRGVGLH